MKPLILILTTMAALNLSAANQKKDVADKNISKSRIALIQDAELSGPAQHGISKLISILESRNISVTITNDTGAEVADYYIFAGLWGGNESVDLHLKVLNIQVPEAPEALVIQRSEYKGKPALILCGFDETGLMYAILDAAKRIDWAESDEDLFLHIEAIQESPYLVERAISMYTMQRAHFERFLHDDTHMERYFDLLAASRINSFVLIFGYENGGFMAPAYPYFYDVEGFPDVELVGTSNAQQMKNTRAFSKLIEIAHQRGIRVTPAFWDYIYRGEVQGGGIPGASELAGTRTPHLVSGVTTENLVAYNKAAFNKFLEVFPDVDAIQFRVHWESGLTREETPAFWHDMLTNIKNTRPEITLDLRAKGLPDLVIEDAIEMGLNIRITTKYWMEQMGLPFHPTHINKQNQQDRRHGYADLLKYPKRYQMHWRMWSGGTARMLLWSDPEYVRRFASAARIYGGNSFEVNEMLATKMLSADHDAEPFDLLNPKHRYYDYEFERYWAYYMVWGRVSYNPETPAVIWEREYGQRYGSTAGKALMEGIQLASRVLPRIVAASYPYSHFPTTRGWAEMQRQYDLPVYAKAEGSDIEQFMNMRDFAEMLLEGSYTPKRTPLQTSLWFSSISEQILEKVDQAENADDRLTGNDFSSSLTDLRILAHLADYHAHRLLAGVHYNLYEKAEDLFSLDQAIAEEEKARNAWARIVESAGDVYNKQLIFGVKEVGFPRHWDEQLNELDEGLMELKEMRSQSKLSPAKEKRDYLADHQKAENMPPAVSLEKVIQATPGKNLCIHARVSDPSGVKSVHLRFRHMTQFDDYQSIEMKLDRATGIYKADIPGEFIIPKWDLIYFIEAIDGLGNGCMIPDLELEMPYVVVRTSGNSSN